MKERRTEVTVETETLLVVRRGGAARGWCDACGAEVALLTPLAAARASGVSTRLVYARLEAGLVHFAELPDGTLLVCGPSAGTAKH
jgi:hypothetical protein